MDFILFFISFGVVAISIVCILWRLRHALKSYNEKSVCVVVLGDLGRSPRIQYHVLSFVREGYSVDIIGLPGSLPLKEIQTNTAVKIHYLMPLPKWNNRIPLWLRYIVKTLWQSYDLLRFLFVKIKCNYLMLQNPPAIPTMPVCWLYCCVFHVNFVIDWHNYAYSVMAMTATKENFFVKITKFLESFIGARADINFCVSKAMQEDLKKRWNINANVLYDKPSKDFKSINLSEKHSLLKKLSETYEEFGNCSEHSTALTECLPNGKIKLKVPRPALIVSSTSWTEDEDFSILLSALEQYESTCSNGIIHLPDLICAITGKGPLKKFWIGIIKLKKWKHIKVVTPWLENEDYPRLLATADLGISLHTSSSGLDLPMKIVDMYGCTLPVCAYNFQCLNELVKHEENSLIFSNDKELADQLITWFTNFPTNDKQIMWNQKFRKELENFQKFRWHDNWLTVVLPCFNALSK